MGGGDNKMDRGAYESRFDDTIEKLSEEAKEEAIQQKNARMSINKQGNHKMRDKPLFPRMRMPIRK